MASDAVVSVGPVRRSNRLKQDISQPLCRRRAHRKARHTHVPAFVVGLLEQNTLLGATGEALTRERLVRASQDREKTSILIRADPHVDGAFASTPRLFEQR